MSNTGDPAAESDRTELPLSSAAERVYEVEPQAVERDAGADTVTIHRSPRYFRFMIAGGIAGVIIALILTFAFPEPPGFNPAQIFGFLGILFVVIGVTAGSVVALVLDRVSRRRAKTIQVERVESVDEG